MSEGLLVLGINLLIGFFVGLTGVSGFLLAIFYIGVLHLPLQAALALSYVAFTIQGIVGSWVHWRAGIIDARQALVLGLASIPGAYIGVLANTALDEHIARVILYLFVLLSGALVLRGSGTRSGGSVFAAPVGSRIDARILFVLGFSVAALSALAGAGGPILLIPILLFLGVGARTTLGVSMVYTVTVGLPAAIGYLVRVEYALIAPLLGMVGLGALVGVTAGAHAAHRVQPALLKRLIAAVALISSVFMLIREAGLVSG